VYRALGCGRRDARAARRSVAYLHEVCECPGGRHGTNPTDGRGTAFATAMPRLRLRGAAAGWEGRAALPPGGGEPACELDHGLYVATSEDIPWSPPVKVRARPGHPRRQSDDTAGKGRSNVFQTWQHAALGLGVELPSGDDPSSAAL